MSSFARQPASSTRYAAHNRGGNHGAADAQPANASNRAGPRSNESVRARIRSRSARARPGDHALRLRDPSRSCASLRQLSRHPLTSLSSPFGLAARSLLASDRVAARAARRGARRPHNDRWMQGRSRALFGHEGRAIRAAAMAPSAPIEVLGTPDGFLSDSASVAFCRRTRKGRGLLMHCTSVRRRDEEGGQTGCARSERAVNVAIIANGEAQS